MANTPQARKRARQTENRHQHNQTLRSRLRTSIKKVHKATASADAPAAQAAFQAAVPKIDSMVTKGMLHKNTAARYKHRLNAQIKQLTAKA